MSKALPVHHSGTLPPQQLADLFKDAFRGELYGEHQDELAETVQQVKGDLYNRDYIAAFDSQEKRAAYCCRWSPSRAVAYSSLFAHLAPVRSVLTCAGGTSRNVLCVGGGAGGELVAAANLFTATRDFDARHRPDAPADANAARLAIRIVDIADWSAVVDRVAAAVRSSWLFHLAPALDVAFAHTDILQPAASLGLPSLDLLTLLFTTNELFLENRAATVRLFQRLNAECRSGCLLLIVESAGSYSHITVGSKKFPVQFLIDTLLLGPRGREAGGPWTLLSESDALWYRGDPAVDYPVKLENMRFFYRLYVKK
ncbi:FACR222Wp [Eremothecium gossypii FDAG1]|nr:FACR222Wp [Eremothecium gossypii FDAG1]